MGGGSRVCFDCRCGEAMANCLVHDEAIETAGLVHWHSLALNGLASRSHVAARGRLTRVVMVSDDEASVPLKRIATHARLIRGSEVISQNFNFAYHHLMINVRYLSDHPLYQYAVLGHD
jgi:hypothetical protein